MARWVFGLYLFAACGVALAADGMATAQSSTLAPRVTAYGQVMAAITPLRALAAGIVKPSARTNVISRERCNLWLRA